MNLVGTWRREKGASDGCCHGTRAGLYGGKAQRSGGKVLVTEHFRKRQRLPEPLNLNGNHGTCCSQGAQGVQLWPGNAGIILCSE